MQLAEIQAEICAISQTIPTKTIATSDGGHGEGTKVHPSSVLANRVWEARIREASDRGTLYATCIEDFELIAVGERVSSEAI
jgi:hypothetical protein